MGTTMPLRECAMSECSLRRRVLDLGFECDEDGCIFWSQIGPEHARPQCAVEYFGLLGEPGRELAEWLLSLKERADIETALGLRHQERAEEV
jgi:hypothetical protein